MSDMKCPVCKKELRPLAIGWCCDCGMCGDKELWQALIDTKKKLDIAVDALKEINKNAFLTDYAQSVLDKALAKITALEQKD